MSEQDPMLDAMVRASSEIQVDIADIFDRTKDLPAPVILGAVMAAVIEEAEERGLDYESTILSALVAKEGADWNEMPRKLERLIAMAREGGAEEH